MKDWIRVYICSWLFESGEVDDCRWFGGKCDFDFEEKPCLGAVWLWCWFEGQGWHQPRSSHTPLHARRVGSPSDISLEKIWFKVFLRPCSELKQWEPENQQPSSLVRLHHHTLKQSKMDFESCVCPTVLFCHVSKINNSWTRTRIILYHSHESFPVKYSVSSFFKILLVQLLIHWLNNAVKLLMKSSLFPITSSTLSIAGWQMTETCSIKVPSQQH